MNSVVRNNNIQRYNKVLEGRRQFNLQLNKNDDHFNIIEMSKKTTSKEKIVFRSDSQSSSDNASNSDDESDSSSDSDTNENDHSESSAVENDRSNSSVAENDYKDSEFKGNDCSNSNADEKSNSGSEFSTSNDSHVSGCTTDNKTNSENEFIATKKAGGSQGKRNEKENIDDMMPNKFVARLPSERVLGHSNKDNCKHINEYSENKFEIEEEWDNPSATDDLCGKVSKMDIKNFKDNEKCVMFKMVTRDEIRNVNPDFFKLHRRVQRVKVNRMCYSKRFWLAVKFCRKKYSGLDLSHKRICDVFGVNSSTVWRNYKKSYIHYRYMSPVECNPSRQPYFIKAMASNYDELVNSGVIKINEK